MFDDIIAAIPLPALVVGDNAQIVAANQNAIELLGARSLGRHYIAIIRQPVLQEAIEGCLRDGTTRTARYLTTEARRDMTWHATVSKVGTTGAVLVLFEDRSDVEDAGAQRRDFVANVSHELRTPLTALLGFIETLQGAAKDDAAARARFLGIMEREASRMNRLVHDLLSLNRVEAAERVRPSEEVDLVRPVSSVMNALAQLAQERGIQMQGLGLDTPAPVAGDSDQLSQVATNLIENAIKYSPKGSTVTVSVARHEAHPLLRADAVVLSVADSGDGIDPIHIPRLTERFYRIDSHRSREQGGTGLGLAIVKHIVNRHRGRLKIDSTPGEGATFSVILPSYQAAKAADGP